MSDVIVLVLASVASAAFSGWYCYRRGHDKGRQKGLLERDDLRGASGKAIGGGGEPVEPV